MAFASEHSSDFNEYAIYTYDRYDRDQFGINKWQKRKSLHSFDRALKEAKVLFRTNKFQKIEIKQKYHDRKLQKCVSKTLKIFEHNQSAYKETLLIGGAFILLLISAVILMSL